MRRVLMVVTIFTLLMTACATEPAPTEDAGDATEVPDDTSVPEESTPAASPSGPAEETVVNQLAQNLGLQASEISVVSNEETEFSDACLGVEMEGVMCAEVITPGRIIVLEANGIQYEYHTAEDGDRVQPATKALSWKREGGIAGFCDILTAFRSGEVFKTDCSAPTGANLMSTFADILTAGEQQQFNDWMAKFGEVRLDSSDPKGVADRMVVTLDFFGTGSQQPSESEQQDLFKFAQDLHPKVAPLK